MADLFKDLWIEALIGDKEEFFDNSKFLSHGRNFNDQVENDYINFAYKGGRPGVTKNFKSNGTTELPVFMRTDVPDKIQLDNYSTDQLQINFEETMLIAYDKKSSMMEDARLSLVEEMASEGMWEVGPAGNTAKTPVITVNSGNPLVDSYRVILRPDLIAMRKAIDKKYPGYKKRVWNMVMDVDAYWELIARDEILQDQYKHVLNARERGEMFNMPTLLIAGFEIDCDERTAWYSDVNTKLAYGSTPTIGTHLKSTLVYLKNETFITAVGTTKVFDQLNHPGKQADLTSFLVRSYVGPWGMTQANLKHAAAILRTP